MVTTRAMCTASAEPLRRRAGKAVIATSVLSDAVQFPRDVGRTISSVSTELYVSTLARVGALTVLFPLDALKSRVQATTATSPRAVRAAMAAQLSHGRTPRWFAGLLPTLVGHLPSGAAAFGIFTVLHARLRAHHPEQPTALTAAAAAVVADAATALWVAPAETLKIRVQTGLARNAAAALAVGATGRGYWNAVVAQIARDAPFRALHVLLYEKVRAQVLERRRGGAGGANDSSGISSKSSSSGIRLAGNSDELSGKEAIVVGASVGAVAAAVTTPFDVVRTRLMSQRPGMSRVYGHWLSCVARVAQAEGPLALFRGVLPRTVYMAASVALFSVGYEMSRSVVTSDKTALKRKVDDLLHGRPAPR